MKPLFLLLNNELWFVCSFYSEMAPAMLAKLHRLFVSASMNLLKRGWAELPDLVGSLGLYVLGKTLLSYLTWLSG